MLRLQLQTSSSSMIPITDMQYIYDLARCSKCTIFAMLKSTNKLYGTNDECACIHEIDIPFLVNTDLVFRLDQFANVDMHQDDKYFIPDTFNWALLPEKYWDMYIGGDIISEYVPSQDQYILFDKTTKQPILEQVQLYKLRDCNDFIRVDFLNQLEGFLARKRLLTDPETFEGIETNASIRQAFDNKVSKGAVLCRMTNNNIDVAFYFYKSLFSLAKSDTLSLEIRFDRYQTSTFMATFKPKKKKNPLMFNKYGIPFSEKVHCMFVNIIQ